MTRCKAIRLRVDPENIAYVKFILEGHDNLATLSTLDQNRGLVTCTTPLSRLPELLDVLQAIGVEHA